jgi:hypothetical protein
MKQIIFILGLIFFFSCTKDKTTPLEKNLSIEGDFRIKFTLTDGSYDTINGPNSGGYLVIEGNFARLSKITDSTFSMMTSNGLDSNFNAANQPEYCDLKYKDNRMNGLVFFNTLAFPYSDNFDSIRFTQLKFDTINGKIVGIGSVGGRRKYVAGGNGNPTTVYQNLYGWVKLEKL